LKNKIYDEYENNKNCICKLVSLLSRNKQSSKKSGFVDILEDGFLKETLTHTGMAMEENSIITLEIEGNLEILVRSS
jgi:hypothetical protein